MTFTRFSQAVLAVVMLVSMAACDEAPLKKTKAKKPARQHLVEVVTVISKPLSHASLRTGTLAARTLVRFFNQEEGRVDKVAVREGDRVSKGDVLLRLDSRLLAAELDKAIAKRQEAQANLKRAKELTRRNVATQERLGKADADLRVAKADEKLIRTRLDYTTIRAPFGGVITARKIEPGDVAPRHTHVLSMMDPSSLFTSVSVSELMLPRLSVGGTASVRIDALGDASWSARIARVHPTVDARTRQGTVEVDLVPVPPQAMAGQLARVSLRTLESSRRVMPFAALRHDRQGSYVFVVEKGKAVLRRVHTGLRLQNQVEVLDGLADGEQIIVRGFLDLSAGKKVFVMDKKSHGKPGT